MFALAFASPAMASTCSTTGTGATACLSIFAGTATGVDAAPTAGGLAIDSAVNGPEGVAVDSSGNVYIADTNNNLIEEIDHSTGVLSVIAGSSASNAPNPSTTPQTATVVALNTPEGVAVDSSGNVYIADYGNNEIEEIDHTTGDLSVIAGGGSTPPSSTTPTPATDVELIEPEGVAVDSSGDVYIADSGNSTIDEVDHSTKTLSVIAGILGIHKSPTAGQLATKSHLYAPGGVAVDSSGNVYIADTENNMVEKVDHSTGDLSIIAGTSTNSPLDSPAGVAVDSNGDVYIADYNNNEVEKVPPAGQLSVIAGGGSNLPTDSFQAPTSVALNSPNGVAIDSSGDLYIADEYNNMVEKVTPPAPVIGTPTADLPTITGTAREGATLSATAGTWSNAPIGYTYQWQRCASGTCTNIGTATTTDTYTVASADVGDTVQVVVTATNGGGSTTATSAATSTVLSSAAYALSVFAGTGTAGTPTAELAINSDLDTPQGVAWDPTTGDVYIADSNNNTIEKVTPNGQLSVLAGTGDVVHGPQSVTDGAALDTDLYDPTGVAVDPSTGDVYISDTGNGLIEKVTSNGQLSVIAGGINATEHPKDTAQTATQVKLVQPDGVAVDSSGNVYIADQHDDVIDEVTGSGLSVFAGTYNDPGYPESASDATDTDLNSPQGVAVDSSDNVYIADTNNNTIEKVTKTGQLTILAGSESNSPLSYPTGVALDSNGNLYIADNGNSEVQILTPTGGLSVFAGNGNSDGTPLPTINAQSATGVALSNPSGVTVDPATGDVYIADTYNNVIEEVTPPAPVIGTPTADLPAISDTTSQNYAQGDTLSATSGTWTNNPAGYTYQWQRCASGTCTSITGATSSIYTLTSSDVGDTIQVMVTATNGGGSNTATSAVTTAVTSSKSSQTVQFTSTAPSSATVGGSTYTPTGTASSGLTPVITVDSSSTVCSMTNGKVSFIATGTCVLDINQAGDSDYAAASQVQQSFAVGKGSQSVSFSSTAPSAATVGGSTYTPTGTASSGLTPTITVDSSSSGCSMTNGKVTFTAAGTCVLDIDQAGDSSYAAASQAQQSFAVVAATPPAPSSQTVQFTSTAPTNATVGVGSYTPTGTASSGLTPTITVDQSSSGCSIAGGIVSFTAAGTCVLDINQAGNSSYTAATQVQQSFTVVAATPPAPSSQTVQFTSTAPTNPTVGSGSYTPTGQATSGLTPTITVDQSSTGCTIDSNGKVTFTAAGTCVLDINQAGNSSYTAATQVQQSFWVDGDSQSVGFTSSPPASPVVGGVYTPTGTASSGLTSVITVDGSSGSVCSIGSNGQVTFNAAGTCVLDINQSGSSTYAPASQAQQSITVGPASQTVSFTSVAPTGATVGHSYTPTGSASSGLSPVFTIDSSSSAVCSINAGVVTFNAAGVCVIDQNQPGDSDYTAAQQVQQRVTVTAATPPTPPLPGAPQITSVVPGDGEVAVSWNPPASNGATVTGYVVTTAHGTITCKTTTMTCLVTGLTNGQSYIFTVTATTNSGNGASATTTTPATPTAAPVTGNGNGNGGGSGGGSSLPVPSSGGQIISSNGTSTPVAVTTSGSSVTVAGGDVSMSIGLSDRSAAFAHATVTVLSDSTVTVGGHGFLPNSTVAIYIAPGNTVLGTAKVRKDGTYTSTFKISSHLKSGKHAIVSVGITAKARKIVEASVHVISKTLIVIAPFPSGQSNLTPALKATIKRDARTIASSGFRHITLDAFTDPSGPGAYNQRLSIRRANTTATQLQKDLNALGDHNVTVTTTGKGKANPIYNHGHANYPASRRAVITL